MFIYLFILKMLIDFRKTGRGVRDRERERETSMWETSIGCFLYAPWQGTKPATWVCALTSTWTPDLLVCGTMLQLTKPPGQGKFIMFKTFREINYAFIISKTGIPIFKASNKTNRWNNYNDYELFLLVTLFCNKQGMHIWNKYWKRSKDKHLLCNHKDHWLLKHLHESP